ncbi:MAG: PLP-dependent aminotransferase family protein [Elusimicrobia bacterium]|nr:PLP-dependent aminotransferase family protein [Elusimicrobiota bacterium]MDD7501464.1 PLP-dependent aminotransferase family protein [Elusimicrobiota bacterium]MDY5728887.1 PLP-dependent aminotransferase family protein [Elusimicrobiaceae bacterium]
MNYNELFSQVVHRSKASAIRELLKVIARPDIISFAGGLPDPDLFPTKEITDIMHDVLTTSPKQALQYGTTEGSLCLRKELVKLLAQTEHLSVTPDNMIVVSASQQALDMTARLFINPGDSIITASPTYLGALQAFQVAGADIVGAKSDEYGVLAEDLEARLAGLQARGKKCKFVYLVPDFQNPTGTTIPEERRLKILEIVKKYNTFILEDSPYREVRFEGTAARTFYALDEGKGNVITMFTFSKVFVPGFRLGFILGPEEIIRKYVILKQAMDLCTSPILQLAAAEYLKRGLLLAHVKQIIAVYRAKRDLMLKTLAELMPKGVSWTRPEGGLFLWLTLPKHLNATELLPKAIENKVAFVAGVDFYPQGNVFNDMRLNFSYSTPEQIVEGLKRLAQTIQENL